MKQVLVGQPAPDFTAPAVLADGSLVDNFNLAEKIKGKYALLFFYPLDFTFVCPSELIALDNHYDEFKKHGIEVIGISIDSHYTHFAWRNTLPEKGGIGKVKYPLVADVNHQIARDYGVEHPDAHVALRGAFVIDKKGIVRSEIVNDLPLGRNIGEILRLFDAVDFIEQHGEVCPANWKKGEKGMAPTPEGVADYLKSEHENL
jgi:peroxiredoxin (alkyl hydroperoxide reductase subunit C)